ncbi:putative bifunctional diguanylate cyclase/phosphodiesterase [Massilia horti]|uniref:EAL domain-containing protein n=1 Tax=Massilia horti TaxID=2562153 RepID=A0A4Y9T9Q0_9BURK|nr:EAL domain-containing protein [Massilia horti]TFW34816.1 EAL domain-containing protein [Massilia horti]
MASTSLRWRIVITFVGLLVLVMGLVLALVHTSSERIVSSEAKRELALGAKVFQQLLEQNQRQLETAATVLSGDFAFREAIATQDQPTVRSVIGNHARRIHAQVMMVASTDGRLIASTQREIAQGDPFPFPDLIDAAEADGKSAGFRQMRNGQLYQLVLVPIMAPRRIAWVAMGFRVDDRWASDFAGMAGLAVHIVRAGHNEPALLASSFEGAQRSHFAQALLAGGDSQPMDATLYQTARLPLDGDIKAVLQLPVAQVQAPLNTLLARLLMVIAVATIGFAIGSTMLARRIVRPLNDLSAAARRIAMGDYGQPLPRLGGDEIGQLATSFAHMREGIASREEHIIRLAYVDHLTDLPNRTKFLETFEQLPANCAGAVAILNLDRFALINNALGYSVGDRLLRAIGQRLCHLVPQSGMLARLWGDQFAFLLPDADRDAARSFANSVHCTLRDPITLDGQRLDVGGCIGIALYPQDGADASTLLRRAEQAMDEAKRRHAGIAFVGEIGTEPAHEQLSLIGDMREAMVNGDFNLVYQPKQALQAGRIVAAEALLRWRHPQRGMIAPSLFIPFAEQTGFIREITPWLLESVVRQLSSWHESGLDITVSANLSALDLLDPGLSVRVRELLERYAVPPGRLCLEITESALMADPTVALAHLADLAALGIKLSIDDYGVGQASLAYLKMLPVHELKLDRSFITAIHKTPRNAAIVESTIMLAHALGLIVVAEGAETEAEMRWLVEHGCDVAQGYFIARPMPAQQLPGWIASFRLLEAS